MNEEQKAKAVALLAIYEIRSVADGFRASKLQFCVEWWVGRTKFCAPNLADETGSVEGWLHRVLQRLVGELVEVVAVRENADGAPEWAARTALSGMYFSDPGTHPSRFDAIVEALLAEGVGQ
jgi:hypothetical protein